MKLTTHARRRWEERLPHLTFWEEVKTLRPATKRQRRMIMGPTPPPKWGRCSYFISENGAVFVVGEDGHLVYTVLAMATVAKEYRRRLKRRATRSLPRCGDSSRTAGSPEPRSPELEWL